MNINYHQTKGDRSYFEWGDNMQIIRKGKGEIAVTRLCSALSAFKHHRFVLSIGQHGSILLQEIHLPRVTTSCICDGADIPNLDVAASIDMLFSFTDIILLHNYKER